MFKTTSIKQKITLGYYLIPVLIVCLSIFTLVELDFLERRIIFGSRISEFFDTILEIRRFEKNYFLYHEQNDSTENLRYVNKALKLLSLNKEEFYTLAEPEQIIDLMNNLTRYKVLMDYYATASKRRLHPLPKLEGIGKDVNDQQAILESMVRQKGKEILEVADKISSDEHRNLRKILNTSQQILILSILVLCILGIVIGQVLSRMIVRSLTQLEDSMEGIAGGKFEKVEINSKDREIISLTDAVNRMIRELELRQRYLVQSEKLASLGTLLSGVAHELNNPLSNISSSSQILMEEIEEDDLEYKQELLSQIEEQTERAKKIVRSLLEFSRDREFKKEKLPLKGVFEETLRFLKGQLPTNIEISLDVPNEIHIFADKQRMQQVFLNLIKNAIEAMGEQGHLFIKAREYSAEADMKTREKRIFTYRRYGEQCARNEDSVIIEIRDTGPGMSQEVVQKIFDPFFTTKEVGKGSGLGLAIVYEIVEEHDGCIGVDSRLGEGTAFLIRLPTQET